MSAQIFARIKEARLNMGMSQSALAANAGVSLATLQNLEAGRANPEWSTLVSLCQFLELNISVEPKPYDLTGLIALGLPLMGNFSKRAIQFHRSDLQKELIRLTAHLSEFEEKEKSREKMAITGFLWALRDHYPPFWKTLPGRLKSWFEAQRLSSEEIKLRRISLAQLGRSM